MVELGDRHVLAARDAVEIGEQHPDRLHRRAVRRQAIRCRGGCVVGAHPLIVPAEGGKDRWCDRRAGTRRRVRADRRRRDLVHQRRRVARPPARPRRGRGRRAARGGRDRAARVGDPDRGAAGRRQRRAGPARVRRDHRCAVHARHDRDAADRRVGVPVPASPRAGPLARPRRAEHPPRPRVLPGAVPGRDRARRDRRGYDVADRRRGAAAVRLRAVREAHRRAQRRGRGRRRPACAVCGHHEGRPAVVARRSRSSS